MKYIKKIKDTVKFYINKIKFKIIKKCKYCNSYFLLRKSSLCSKQCEKTVTKLFEIISTVNSIKDRLSEQTLIPKDDPSKVIKEVCYYCKSHLTEKHFINVDKHYKSCPFCTKVMKAIIGPKHFVENK